MENKIHSISEDNFDHKVALFIDNDNIEVSCFNTINEPYDYDILIKECAKYGRIVLSKVFLDTITKGRRQFELFKRGIEPVYAPCYSDKDGTMKKSLADPMIICEVMRTLYEKPHIDTFVIVSGDKDFVPLIRTIAQHHDKKRLIVIGVYDSTADLVIDECDRYEEAKFLDYILLHRMYNDEMDEKTSLELENQKNTPMPTPEEIGEILQSNSQSVWE